MKKVCLIVPNSLTVPDVLGGAIESLVTLIIRGNEEFKELDLTVVAPYNKEAENMSKNYKNTKFIYIHKKFLYSICSVFFKFSNLIFKTKFCTYNFFVLNKIKKNDYDFIIIEGGEYDSFTKFLKYFKKEQLILHLHHQWHTTNEIENTFSKIIGVSKFVIDDFKKDSKIENFDVLKNAIDINKFDKKVSNQIKDELRNKYNIKKDDFVVLYCGRLIQVKGVLELIKAIKNIKNDNIKLLIVGSSFFANSKKTEYIEKLEKEMSDIKNRVVFTGFIDNAKLYEIYSIVDILCVPSQWEEAAGLISIEGMISKKPLIVSEKGGIPEYVNKSGAIILNVDKNFIKNLEESIIYLYNNPDIRKKMSKINYMEAQKYNYLSYYKDFVKLINKY